MAVGLGMAVGRFRRGSDLSKNSSNRFEIIKRNWTFGTFSLE